MSTRLAPILGAVSVAAYLVAIVLPACTPAPPAEKSNTQAKAPSSDAQNEGTGTSGTPESGSAGETITAGSDSATVYVLNLANEDICFVYLGDGAGDWTDDLLGAYVLSVGDYLTLSGVAPGTVEMYAEGCNGSDWYGSGTVDSDYTFVLEGGSSDTGYDTGWDSGLR